MALLTQAIRFLHTESDMRSLHGFLRRSKDVRQRSGDNGEMLCLDQKFGLVFEYEDFGLRLFLPRQSRIEVTKVLKATLLTADVIIETETQTLPTPSEPSKLCYKANDRGFTYIFSVSEGEGVHLENKQITGCVGVSIDVHISYRKQGEKLLNDSEHFRIMNQQHQLLGFSGKPNPFRVSEGTNQTMHFGEIFQHAAERGID